MNQLNKLVLLLPLLFMANCEKEPSLGGNPGGDDLEEMDSTVLVSYTELDEPKDALNEGDVALGRLDDPRFGESLASFYSQLRLTTNSYDLGANAILDSAYLVLSIENAYGPLTNPIDFEIYKLTEELDSDNTYESDAVLSTDATVVGSLSGFVYNDESFLKIPLSTTFANELFSQFGTSNMESSDDFLSYLNGIFVTVTSTSGGDGLFDLELIDESSALKLFFRSDAAEDSVYSFLMDAQSLRINQYVHDVAGSEIETANLDLTNDDETILISGLNLSYGEIAVPDLSALDGAVINQAKLTFYQADYGDALNTGYALPEYLLLSGEKDNDSITYFLGDYSSSDPTYYGGTPELVTVNGVTTYAYSYSIPRFIQRVVNQETEITYLNLEVLNFNNGNRVKLGGGKHPTLPITLEILYTKP